MLTSKDLHGVMAMMPAFATPDANDIHSTSTIDVDNLKAGVERMISDGGDVIATTGSFGEFHTLLWDEFETITRATVKAVKGRVPLFIGCTSLNSRETVKKMKFIREAGGDGVLVGVPFYFPSTVDNAVQFYHDIAEMFPDLAIMVYHNPALHNVTLPVDAFKRITQSPNIVAMKDSHRTTFEFLRLMENVQGKMSVFVNQAQYHPFVSFGAAGCWSIDAWMGPWPVLRLRDAINENDVETAKQIILDLTAGSGGPPNLSWRETAAKIAIQQAGYCNPGPLRPPFVNVPEAVLQNIQRRVEHWKGLCDKYRHRVERRATA